MPLDPKDRDRLEKLLNMLGSPVDGEIANAGRMIQKMATRYNVTPADLCLNNRIGSPQAESQRPYPQGHSPFDDLNNPRGFRREQARNRARTEDFYQSFKDDIAEEIKKAREEVNRRAREREAREAEQARQRRQEEAMAKSARKAKSFPGTYFGLLARLKAIYEDKFDDLDTWKIDFIEIVLRDCKADRQMTIRQREMAKAVIKYTEDTEPLV